MGILKKNKFTRKYLRKKIRSWENEQEIIDYYEEMMTAPRHLISDLIDSAELNILCHQQYDYVKRD